MTEPRRELSYAHPGISLPPAGAHRRVPAGFRFFERSVPVGRGAGHWEAISAAVLGWEVKSRSGFAVLPQGPVEAGGDYWLATRIGPVRIREPVRVVAVLREPDRAGFAYGTLTGHPVCGEEAFVVDRHADGSVWFTLRSLTRAAPGARRLIFPAALVAQRVYRRRYLRALLCPP